MCTQTGDKLPQVLLEIYLVLGKMAADKLIWDKASNYFSKAIGPAYVISD